MAIPSSHSTPSIPPKSKSATPGPSNALAFKFATFDQVLDDLSCRFILNLPEEELRSIERVCFQVEQAHWYYEDFIREANPKLPSLPLKKFSAELFSACPMLQHWSHDHEQAFNQFMAYKTRVPVCGAIMLNHKMDKCLLVKGYKASSGWGFPKGKINQNERECDCAIREVLEETGYDLTHQINEDDYFNTSVREQSITLFVVSGVPEDFEFKTRTRKEISKIEWFRLSDLPTWKRKREAPGKFYLITPFISQLKDFIATRKRERKRSEAQTVKLSVDDQSTIGIERSSGEESPIKEDSSLSSSTGNGGPNTPSPERALFLNGGPKSHSEPPLAMLGLSDFSNLDPHLANLLNNLSLSANGPSPAAVSNSSVVPVHSSTNETPAEKTPSLHNRNLSASIHSDERKTAPPPPPVENPSTPSQLSAAAEINLMSSTLRFPSKRAKHLALLDSVVEDLATLPQSSPSLHNTYPSPHYLPPYGYGRPASAFAPQQSHLLSRHNYSASAEPLAYMPNGPYGPYNVPYVDGSLRPASSMSHIYSTPAIVPQPMQAQTQPPLGSHQNHLLNLLSPRTRAASQPVPPPHITAAPATLYNTYPNVGNDDVPALPLAASPPNFGPAPGYPLLRGKSDVGSRASSGNLLSILNGVPKTVAHHTTELPS